MSKKRTSDECCQSAAEEQANNGAAPDVPHDEDNAKRVKLTPFMSDMTLKDLPFELIESILIKVIAMEVKSMKLAKSVWKVKAELVINRLADVCSQWSNVLSTDGFRIRLHRALQEDHGAIRLEILQQHTVQFDVSCVTGLGDEVFLLSRRYPGDTSINVYDWGNMAEVKYRIPLPLLDAEKIVACTVSNCVYILNRNKYKHYSILRITGDSDPRWSTLRELIEDTNLPGCSFCVAANGNLILSRKQSIRIPAISVYDAAGSLQQTIRLPSDITEFYEMIPKPTGNLALSRRSFDQDDDDNDDDDDDDYDDYDYDDYDYDDQNYDWQATLTEIDMNGTKISQYRVSLDDVGHLDIHSSIVDSHGRMMALAENSGIQLFDSDFNRMEFAGPQLIVPGRQPLFHELVFHHNSERNETIMIDADIFTDQSNLTVFQLEEQ